MRPLDKDTFMQMFDARVAYLRMLLAKEVDAANEGGTHEACAQLLDETINETIRRLSRKPFITGVMNE